MTNDTEPEGAGSSAARTILSHAGLHV